jgi:Fic family protein
MSATHAYSVELIRFAVGQAIMSGKFPQEKKKEIEQMLFRDIPGIRSVADIPRPLLFTERLILSLHKTIASDIMPEGSKVDAGHYRIDNRIAGWDMPFPSPELVPRMMTEFFLRADNHMQKSSSGEINIFETAALISHDFVSIHPFPDFNGRVSRVIMNMVLQAFLCPFPVSLKATGRERHSYFSSLRKANNGKIAPLASLIAKRVVETFVELDRHLRKASVQRLLDQKVD